MKRVQVLIPFHMSATNTDHVPNDIIEVTEETLAKIRAINVNMVLVLEDVEEPVVEEVIEEVVEEPVVEEGTEEVIEENVEAPKKTRSKKK